MNEFGRHEIVSHETFGLPALTRNFTVVQITDVHISAAYERDNVVPFRKQRVCVQTRCFFVKTSFRNCISWGDLLCKGVRPTNVPTLSARQSRRTHRNQWWSSPCGRDRTVYKK